ncbi:fimbrial protein [Enterobacter cloacae]|nr:hypothetical protein [Enterobacter cloacae]
MKTFGYKLLCTIFLYSTVTYCTQVLAAQCTINTLNDSIPLTPANISVGADMPNGTVIYRLNSQPEVEQVLRCTANNGEKYNLTSYLTLRNEPHPLSNWSGNPFPGEVYETNIPGIGVAVWYSFRATTLSNPEILRNYNFESTINLVRPLNDFDISLVKTGPVTPGTITGADIPLVRLEFRSPDGTVTNLPITMRDVTFTGSLNITVPSCQTPNVVVNMGEHEIRTDFNGPGSVTNWVNANFSLTNCPVFYGYYNDSAFPSHLNDSNTVIVPDSIPNLLSITVAPFTPVIDADNGIFAIDTSSSDSGSGVGIQLGYDTGSINPVKLNSPFTYTTNSNGDPTIILPFRARYIQTERLLTPGRANGRVSVTINYN